LLHEAIEGICWVSYGAHSGLAVELRMQKPEMKSCVAQNAVIGKISDLEQEVEMQNNYNDVLKGAMMVHGTNGVGELGL
jgi:hypothetical protein